MSRPQAVPDREPETLPDALATLDECKQRVETLRASYVERRDQPSLMHMLAVIALPFVYGAAILLMLIVMLLSTGCSSGSEPDAEPPPAVISAPLPPPAPPPAPVAVDELPGRVWAVRMPTTLYSDNRGLCMMRYPYEPGPSPYNVQGDFLGACFATVHHDWYFEIRPRSRSGTAWYGLDTTQFRGELRNWRIESGKPVSYAVVAELGDMVIGTHDYWVSTDRDLELVWSNMQPALPVQMGNPITVIGDETEPANAVGVYRARRDGGGSVDLTADYLITGVDMSLTIDADGAIWGQGSDGCTVTGSTSDSLAGVWRVTLASSCTGRLFTAWGAAIGDRVYLAGRSGSDKLVIVGTRP